MSKYRDLMFIPSNINFLGLAHDSNLLRSFCSEFCAWYIFYCSQLHVIDKLTKHVFTKFNQVINTDY